MGPVNLTYLLKKYKPTEAKMDSDEGLKQQEIEKKLCKILAMGANKLNPIQQNAVKEFQAKFSKTNPDDIVVKVVNELVTNLKKSDQVSKMMPNLPEDIKVAIDVNKDVSTLMDILRSEDILTLKENLSEEMQIKLEKLTHMLNIAVHAAGRLSDAASEDAPLNYSDLLQFTKVIVGFGFILLDNDALKNIVQALYDIKEKTDHNDKLASEFIEMAKMVIKKHEAEHLPPALDEQFKKCNAYHGKAISDGIIAIQNELLKTGNVDQSLLNFAIDYCGDHLKRMQYLIRLSSNISNDIEKNKFYVITITSRPRSLSLREVNNWRVTCIDHSKGGPWVVGMPPKEPKEGEELTKKWEKKPRYETLEDLIKAIRHDYKPCTPPTPLEAKKYINAYINVNL